MHVQSLKTRPLLMQPPTIGSMDPQQTENPIPWDPRDSGCAQKNLWGWHPAVPPSWMPAPASPYQGSLQTCSKFLGTAWAEADLVGHSVSLLRPGALLNSFPGLFCLLCRWRKKVREGKAHLRASSYAPAFRRWAGCDLRGSQPQPGSYPVGTNLPPALCSNFQRSWQGQGGRALSRRAAGSASALL